MHAFNKIKKLFLSGFAAFNFYVSSQSFGQENANTPRDDNALLNPPTWVREDEEYFLDWKLDSFVDPKSDDPELRAKERTKLALDFLWYYPEDRRAKKKRGLLETLCANVESKLFEDYFYLMPLPQDLIFDPFLDEHYEKYRNKLEDINLGVITANAAIKSLIAHYKWAQDIDRFIKDVRYYSSVRYSLEDIHFQVGGRLDDYYSPLVEATIRGFPWFEKITYERSEHLSRWKLRHIMNNRGSLGFLIEKEWDEDGEGSPTETSFFYRHDI